MNEELYMERLERLQLHPDAVTGDELRQWMRDGEFATLLQTAQRTQRAALQRVSHPAAQQAYARFRQQHMAPRRTRHWLRHAVTAVAACAALLLAFAMGRYWERTNTAVQIYTAQAYPQGVTLTMGSETIALTADEDAAPLLADMSFDTQNGLQYAAEPQSSPDLTPHTVSVPTGTTFQMTLPDGTHVWLGAESMLTYPHTFASAQRVVELQGEAYFEVTKDAAKPFVVRTTQMETKVLGTSFNVRSYPALAPHITLVEGLVEVTHEDERLVLQPGQDATLSHNGALLRQVVDVDIYTCWREGRFYFDNMLLGEITTEIGRWYGVDVRFEHPKHLNDPLHFHAERDWTLAEVVEQLDRISDARIHISDGTLVVE